MFLENYTEVNFSEIKLIIIATKYQRHSHIIRLFV